MVTSVYFTQEINFLGYYTLFRLVVSRKINKKNTNVITVTRQCQKTISYFLIKATNSFNKHTMERKII